MFPWSVMPSAGWPSATAASTRSLDPRRAVEHRELGVGVQVGERPLTTPATSSAMAHVRATSACENPVDNYILVVPINLARR